MSCSEQAESSEFMGIYDIHSIEIPRRNRPPSRRAHSFRPHPKRSWSCELRAELPCRIVRTNGIQNGFVLLAGARTLKCVGKRMYLFSMPDELTH